MKRRHAYFPVPILPALALAACSSGPEPSATSNADRSGIWLDSMAISTDLPSGSGTRLAGSDTSSPYQLIKFPGPVSRDDMARLRAQVDRIYTYLPHDTFLVRARTSVDAFWSSAYQPEHKIPRALRDRMALSSGSEQLLVQVFPDADLDAIASRLQRAGATILGRKPGNRFSRVRLRAPASLVSALAAIPEVFWIEPETRRVLYNDTTVWVGQSGLSGGQTTPIFDKGIHGEGQTVAVLDTGIDPDSCYFRDTALNRLPPANACNGAAAVDAAQRKILAVDFLASAECNGGISGSEWDTQGHGTHVAGTIAGDNFAHPIAHDSGDGMAPGAKLVVQDGGYGEDDCADLPGIGCPVVDLNPIFQQAYDQGARLHSNSWGDQENASVQNNYTAGSQDVDEFMWNHKDFLVLFAAGNSGPGTGSVGSPSTAKSGISVGATQRAASANSMASFSSCGPTDDNRVKPDITVPGSGIVSARNDTNTASNNCNTTSMSGTSMATPGAAGFGALVRQYYTDGFYPSGAANTADRLTPSAALIKATMINSATPMTNAGSIPGNCQGWGRVLLDDALYFTGQPRRLLAADDAGFPQGGSGQVKTFTLDVDSSASLKVTLTWTDYPSTPAANPHLNNDLDLEVKGPGGTYLGNVLTNGGSTTGGSADRRNTVEQVILASPPSGTYTITVRGFNLPSGDQPFSLVATYAARSAPADAGTSDAGDAGDTPDSSSEPAPDSGPPANVGADAGKRDTGSVNAIDNDVAAGSDGCTISSGTGVTTHSSHGLALSVSALALLAVRRRRRLANTE
ncbi:S8 family serine peptidase [Pendulispora rubella]|uniref:S8 family serine peptidase n=1 Tax=Pendulispora rubella TaxID=2741070 RepID=A0ABZ2LH87_9BACT